MMAKDPVSSPPEISEEDVYEAMKAIEGYLDITPGDFRILYGVAYRHAVSRLARSVKAADVMTRDVIKAYRETPLQEVARMMAARAISGLPIVDPEDRVIGVISEKDFAFPVGGGETLRSFMEVVAYSHATRGCLIPAPAHRKAEDIMSHPAVTVRGEATLSEAANLMAEKNVNRLPVTDKEGKLLGIVARADIVQTSCTVIIPPKE